MGGRKGGGGGLGVCRVVVPEVSGGGETDGRRGVGPSPFSANAATTTTTANKRRRLQCAWFATPVELGPNGMTKNHGLGELDDFEKVHVANQRSIRGHPQTKSQIQKDTRSSERRCLKCFFVVG